VIALPAFMGVTALYGVAHYFDWGASLALGGLALVACLALFVCTGMIYACLKFLREWASPLTLVNFLLLGSASGFTLAAALAAWRAPALTAFYVWGAILLTAAGLLSRVASLVRNARLKPKSTLQTAIGVKHSHITQITQGFMGGSFNTREFFHGQSRAFLQLVKWTFLVAAFLLPLTLLATGLFSRAPALLAVAFTVQYVGLLAERWFFFAQANHPQNLYYQAIA
jgi:DMSO reductase anchor subunit